MSAALKRPTLGLKPQDFSRVSDAVKKFEGTTRGELVPLVISDSVDYSWVRFQAGLYGFALALMGGELWSIARTWPLDAREVTIFALGGALLGTLAAYVPAIARRIIGASRLAKGVHRRALSEFVEHGCGDTRERIGVLVMVSLFERRIEIIADRGIASKVAQREGPEVWDSVTREFAQTAHAGRAVDGLVTVIERVGGILARHFPPDPNRPNELSDELRTERGND